MTVNPGDGSGDEGVKDLSRKLEGCEEEESGEQGSEESNTKRAGDGIPDPAFAGPSEPSAVPSTSTPTPPGHNSNAPQQTSTPTAQSQDQHHFLRSSVRPPNKRLRKDAIASPANGHSGARGKGEHRGACGASHLWWCTWDAARVPREPHCCYKIIIFGGWTSAIAVELQLRVLAPGLPVSALLSPRRLWGHGWVWGKSGRL